MTSAVQERDSQVPVAQDRHYLYAITSAGECRRFPSIGIEGKDVYTIEEGPVAGVVSTLTNPRIRPERANLTAHQAVLRQLMEVTTPLPMTFGTVASSPAAIRRILARNQEIFLGQLQRVAGKAEMGLRVTWEVPNIFDYFVKTHSELRLARDRLVGARGEPSQEERIELGRMFDRLLNEDRANHTQEVKRAITGVCFEVKVNSCRNEYEVMNLACLVGRDSQNEFCDAVFGAAKLFDNHFSFDYSGPWAPHNFVSIELER